MRVIVFGAGGFVGGWICEMLSEQDGVNLVGGVRKWASAVRIARRGISIAQSDLSVAKDLPALVKGADVVINAAMLPAAREPDLVCGLYQACASVGVRRFVQLSSAAVYGSQIGEIDENTPTAAIDDYSRGKAEMEAAVIKLAATSGPQLMVLRPSIVYGPFSDAWTVRFAQRISKARWRGLGPLGAGTCNLIHAGDLAKAVIAAATVSIDPGCHVLNINGPDVVSWNDYLERFGDALETPNRVVPNATFFRAKTIVTGFVRRGGGLGVVKSLYRRSVGNTRAAMIRAKEVTDIYPTSEELALFGRKVHYSANRAAKVLRMEPETSLETGLKQCALWCRVHGII